MKTIRKRVSKAMLFTLVLMTSVNSYSQSVGWTGKVKIDRIGVHKHGGNYTFAVVGDHKGIPCLGNGGTRFVNLNVSEPNAKSLLSLALSAHMSGKEVVINVGETPCVLHNIQSCGETDCTPY